MLTLFNSMTKQKEVFKPLKPNQVSMYVCGVTVYDHCHLGHARCMIVFDIFSKYLRHLGYQVKFVSNITDIDDKIIKKALELEVSYDVVSQTITESMHQDAQALGVNLPDVAPKATEHIEDMIHMIQTLIDKGFAYVAGNGDVCFEVNCFHGYGKLSRQDLNQLMAGVRIDASEQKRSPADFVLWKQAKPGEPSWSSPWGSGRPGWHIECSAMAKAHLGAHIDIHGGGLDLQFPHHENEIAQSEACNEEVFANYWLHVGMLQLNHEKMAKSTGNFLTIKEALTRYHPEVIKMFYMSSHYRSPLNFTDDALQQAHKSLQRFYQTIKTHSKLLKSDIVFHTEWVKRFEDAMNDDFNTSQALAILFELNNQMNKTPDACMLSTLMYLANLLGILHSDASAFLQFSINEEQFTEQEIEMYIEKRKQARLDKDFSEADRIRQFLLEKGIELEDQVGVTSWRRRI